MIHFIEPGKDMFEGKHQCLINTVNTDGIMGGGIAAEMIRRFPSTCNRFNKRCKNEGVSGGRCILYSNYDTILDPAYIFMFATKQEIWKPSKYEYIQEGLKEMVRYIRRYNITNIAIPPLGCGLGGLEWPKVKEMILEAIAPITDSCEVYIYEQ